MYCYVTCRLDISCAIITFSKFATRPTKLHYTYLKGVVGYLHRTKHLGIRYHCNCQPTDYHPDLPEGDFSSLPPPLLNHFSDFPSINHSELTCFVDAAYANDLHQGRSTTGFAIALAGGAVVYRSKTQSVTALSSTEAEFFAAVSVAKSIIYLRSILKELKHPLATSTPIYEDNVSPSY